jgi:general secretion pathway protein N
MKRWTLVAIGLFLLFALIQLPAAWIAPQLARATRGGWRIGAVEGTVWGGRATLYALNRATAAWYPGHALRWRLSPERLLHGIVTAHVELDHGGRAEFYAGNGGWSLEHVDGVFSAAELAVLLPGPLSAYGWSGAIHARSSAFRCAWGVPRCTGQVEFTWRDAGTAQIPGGSLGDYAVLMTAEGDALHFDLATLAGSLHIKGAGDMIAGRLRFDGEAYATGQEAPRLETLLRAIGRPGSAAGHYLIQYREGTGAQ